MKRGRIMITFNFLMLNKIWKTRFDKLPEKDKDYILSFFGIMETWITCLILLIIFL